MASSMASMLSSMAGNFSSMTGSFCSIAGSFCSIAGSLFSMAGNLSSMTGSLCSMAGNSSYFLFLSLSTYILSLFISSTCSHSFISYNVFQQQIRFCKQNRIRILISFRNAANGSTINCPLGREKSMKSSKLIIFLHFYLLYSCRGWHMFDENYFQIDNQSLPLHITTTYFFWGLLIALLLLTL